MGNDPGLAESLPRHIGYDVARPKKFARKNDANMPMSFLRPGPHSGGLRRAGLVENFAHVVAHSHRTALDASAIGRWGPLASRFRSCIVVLLVLRTVKSR